MSDGNVYFLNPGRFGVLYNQRVIAKFLAPSSIPSQKSHGDDSHGLRLLQGILYVGGVAAGGKAYQNITFRSQGCRLPFEDAFEAIVIADCGQDGSVGCHGDGGQAFPFGHETSDEFGSDMLGIGCISEMKLAFDEIFKLSLLSPFQSAEESEEYAFFNIESSLLGI